MRDGTDPRRTDKALLVMPVCQPAAASRSCPSDGLWRMELVTTGTQTAVKVLHAADVHLDAPLRGLPQYEGAPVEEMRGATRRAFSALVDLAIEEEVGLVVIAGDCSRGRAGLQHGVVLQR